MGRRTLVVSPRADGRFDCRYAHWGVTTDPVTQSRQLGSGWSAERVLGVLNAGFDRLLVRDDGPRWYCVCWLDPTLSDPDDIALARTDDPDGLREWWTVAKSDASAAVADGIDPGRVRAWLLARLAASAEAVYRPDDAWFLSDGR